MKFLIAFIAIALAAVFVPQAECGKCNVSCDPYSVTQVCGKFNTRCMRFANGCKRKVYNCAHGVAYMPVDISRCANIGVGKHSTCQPASSKSLVYLNGLGGSSSSGYSGLGSSFSPISPIIIRV